MKINGDLKARSWNSHNTRRAQSSFLKISFCFGLSFKPMKDLNIFLKHTESVAVR